MSASREKKKRQEFLANGGVDPKAEREAERKKAEKKSKIIYISVFVAFLAITAALLIKNYVLDADFVQRNKTAMTINGEKYTVADVCYYYGNAYQYEMTNGYGSYFIDTTKPLSDQQYIFDSTMTWAQYFRNQTASTMQLIHAAVKAAEAEGMTLNDEYRSSLETQIAGMKAQAEANKMSYKEYLKSMYGSYMTVEVYEKNLERTLLASQYTKAHYDNISFTDEEVQAYYEKNKNTYDIVDGAYVTISAAPETKKDEDGKTIEATEEEKSAAKDAAFNTATLILNGYNAGDDLEELAKVYDATYAGDVDLKYGTSKPLEWLFNEERVAGDSEIIFDETTNNYYIVIFNSRQREEALNYDIRHILVTDANLNLAEGEKAGEGEVALAAQTILDEWKKGDMTEESFAALAEKYSQDGGSIANGGLYEDVLKGQMVAEFVDWCYAEGRQHGDTDIVETTYRHHIMFFVGYSEDANATYWYTACHNAMAEEAYNTWETNLINSAVCEFTDAMDLVG